MVRILAVMLSLAITGAANADSPGAFDKLAFTSLSELESALHSASSDEEAFWQRIKASGTMPLVFGKTAVFLYRGKATSVEWRGDFSSWAPGWDTQGEHIQGTSLWRKSLQLLPGSRLDYKIVIDGDQWLLDPLNPHRQLGGGGENSEARMPEWQPSPYVRRDDETPRGTLTPDITLHSRVLDYAVNYRVYTPPNLSATATGLPSLYVTDGQDYAHDDMGSMVIVLDNLYAAGLLQPVIVVFVDPRDVATGRNRRTAELVPQANGKCAFCKFLVRELVPAIDNSYPTARRPGKRGILGTSLGGQHATHMGIAHRSRFALIGIQSPAYHFPPDAPVLRRLLQADELPDKVFLNVGQYERQYIDHSERVANHLRDSGVELLYLPVPDGHSWGHWRTVLDDALIFFFGRTGAPQ